MPTRVTSLLSVYPRWRGEHERIIFSESMHNGLSPLARGTHAAAVFPGFFLRFIPAGAGNTDCHQVIRSDVPVYPRWRGEHLRPQSRNGLIYGLSPLARGTRTLRMISQLPRRFIPAGAGNTFHNNIFRIISPVYPRWRGEHLSSGALVCTSPGLSPLARGTRPVTDLNEREQRFIPAGAGNTS